MPAYSSGVLLVGRAAFAGLGAPTSAELISAQKQADADFTCVMAELQPG